MREFVRKWLRRLAWVAVALLVLGLTLFSGRAGATVSATTHAAKVTATPKLEKCNGSGDLAFIARFDCKMYERILTHGSLQAYFKYVSAGKLRGEIVSEALGFDYTKDARVSIIKAVAKQGHPIAKWPKGTNKVYGPTVEIVGVIVNSCGKTLLVTRESWKVKSANGVTLYHEDETIHTIVMGDAFQITKNLIGRQDLTLADCSK